MQQIVISKMADHHAPLFPLWLWWYRNVCVCQRIWIAAAKTGRVDHTRTLEFFSGIEGVTVVPYSGGYLDHEVWWAEARTAIDADRPLRPFALFNADADEFYEPVPPAAAEFATLHRQAHVVPYMVHSMVCHAGCPELHEMRTAPIEHEGVEAWIPFKGVCLNKYVHGAIDARGQFRGPRWKAFPLPQLPRLYHFNYTGAGMFAAKLDALTVAPRDTRSPWRRWITAREQGPQTVEELYRQRTARAAEDVFAEAFRRYFPEPRASL